MIRPCLLLSGALLYAVCAFPQGMISGNARAQPKGKLSGRPWPVSFSDVAAEAGLNFRFTSGHETRKKYVIEANGSGVALLDYDNDGLLDVFLVNGSRLEGFAGGRAPANRLYRNRGKGKFADVTAEAGVAHGGWGNGVCAGDYDNDGNLDMYVTYYGRNLLYRNDGKSGFAEAGVKAGVAGTGKDWSTGCTFTDYDRDGYLDLLVTSYLDFRRETAPLPGSSPFCFWKGSPVYCGPRGLPFGRVTLYRNVGNGTFTDVSVASGIRSVRNFYAFTAAAADFNGDDWPDVYVACDSTPSILFRNEKNGTFKDIGTEAGVAYNENGAEQAGMGLSVGDFDNDGRLDIVKTNFSGDYPNLYRNLGRGVFTDVSVKSGLAVNPDHVLWGSGLVDLDNDGWRDIVQVSGHVYPDSGAIDAREPYKRPRLVYRNLSNGRFEDVSAISGPGIKAEHSSRGVAFGDIDNDGLMDALVMNMHEAPSLLRNTSKPQGHWLKLKLEGAKSNRAAIGAEVSVEGAGADVVLSQSSFLSVNDLRLHFGLGASTISGKVTVRWPSGAIEEFPPVAADRLYLLVEGSWAAKPLPLPQ